MAEFDASGFAENKIKDLKESIGDAKVLAAVSGGVDSTTAATLVRRAIESNVFSVFMDTGFMRISEPESIAETLSALPLPLNVEVVDARKRFLDRMKGVPNAERKRKIFRAIFYEVLSEEARKRQCSFLVQGTIAPDWIETQGRIKTQHNVLSQIGIDPQRRYGFKVLEPLVDLYKWQTREVAKFLGIREELFQRQPFPGPGVSVRMLGAINERKLETVRKADAVVRRHLDSKGCDQYFAAVLDGRFLPGGVGKRAFKKLRELLSSHGDGFQVSVLLNKATGMESGARKYGNILALSMRSGRKLKIPPISDLTRIQKHIIDNFPRACRVLVETSGSPRKASYFIVIRSVQTRDFMKADVSGLDSGLLSEISQDVLKECPGVARVYYDVTPKPPATIEFE